MDEKERNTGEFSLEDILKEFGEGIPLDAEEDITIWDGNIPEPVEAVPEVSGDTVRARDKETGESLDKDRFRLDLENVSLGYSTLEARLEAKN